MNRLDAEYSHYGTKARLGCLIDLVEAHVLSSSSVLRFAELSDALRDSSITKSEVVSWGASPLPDGERDEVPIDWIKNEMLSRQRVLTTEYPFDFQPESVCSKTNKLCAYSELLGLTLAHAFELAPSGVVPDRDFEDVVTAYLERMFANRVISSGRNRGKFDALIQRFRSVGFDAGSTNAVHSSHANDDGADAVAWCWLADERLGVAGFVVQATVGDSDSWEQKAGEANGVRWSRYLGNGTPFGSVLAVPHAMDRESLSRITDAACRPAVIDRLRLVKSGTVAPGKYAGVATQITLEIL